MFNDSNWNHLIVCKGMSYFSSKNNVAIEEFRGQNEDTKTREVGWNKCITITEQIYRIQVLYNCLKCSSGTVRQLGGYRYSSNVPETMWYKAFFRWGPAQNCNPDTPVGSKNASGPVALLLKKRVLHMPGDKPGPSKEGQSLGLEDASQGAPRLTVTGTRTHLTRSAHR